MAVVKIDIRSMQLAKFLAHNMCSVCSKNHLMFFPLAARKHRDKRVAAMSTFPCFLDLILIFLKILFLKLYHMEIMHINCVKGLLPLNSELQQQNLS